MKDVLRPFVPEYKGQVTCEDGERILYQIKTYFLYYKSKLKKTGQMRLALNRLFCLFT